MLCVNVCGMLTTLLLIPIINLHVTLWICSARSIFKEVWKSPFFQFLLGPFVRIYLERDILNKEILILNHICDALRDLVPFKQF